MQDIFSTIEEKFPKGAPNISDLSEEQKAWLHLKIQSISNADSFQVVGKLQKIHCRLLHATEDIPDEEFQKIVSFIFNNLDEIKKLSKD